MKIFILEYFLSKSSFNNKQCSFYNEAVNIFQSILNSALKTKDIEIYSWLNESFSSAFNMKMKSKININYSRSNFNSLAEYYSFIESLTLDNLDYFLIIAPETDNILYQLTKILENKGIKNLGSSSTSIKKTANKWLLKKSFAESNINMPKTKLINNQLIREKKFNNSFFPAVIKEFYGAGSELIKVNDFQALKNINLPKNKNYLIQKIINGTAGSLSVLANQEKAELLTINKQIIVGQNFKYQGGIINYPFKNSSKSNEIIATTKEKYPDLKGYFGIDFIYKDNDYYLLEINPRLTSSLIGLVELYNPIKYIVDLERNNSFPKLKNKTQYKFLLS